MSFGANKSLGFIAHHEQARGVRCTGTGARWAEVLAGHLELYGVPSQVAQWQAALEAMRQSVAVPEGERC